MSERCFRHENLVHNNQYNDAKKTFGSNWITIAELIFFRRQIEALEQAHVLAEAQRLAQLAEQEANKVELEAQQAELEQLKNEAEHMTKKAEKVRKRTMKLLICEHTTSLSLSMTSVTKQFIDVMIVSFS